MIWMLVRGLGELDSMRSASFTQQRNGLIVDGMNSSMDEVRGPRTRLKDRA